jgi:hypothetical protein
MISGFRRELGENCALLGYYEDSSGNFLPTCWDFGFFTFGDGIDRLSRKVGKKLPQLAA